MLIVITRNFTLADEQKNMLAALTAEDAVLLQADGCYCGAQLNMLQATAYCICFIQQEDALARGLNIPNLTLLSQHDISSRLTPYGNWVIWS